MWVYTVQRKKLAQRTDSSHSAFALWLSRVHWDGLAMWNKRRCWLDLSRAFVSMMQVVCGTRERDTGWSGVKDFKTMCKVVTWLKKLIIVINRKIIVTFCLSAPCTSTVTYLLLTTRSAKCNISITCWIVSVILFRASYMPLPAYGHGRQGNSTLGQWGGHVPPDSLVASPPPRFKSQLTVN